MRRYLVSSILGVIVLFTALDSFYTISEMEQAIITQFGKPIGEGIREPGLKFKIPFIQKINRFEKRFIQWDGDPNEIPTSDKTFIWVDATARWRIVNPLVFLQRIGSESRAGLVLNNLINGALRDLITKNSLIEVILSSDGNEEYLIAADEERIKESLNIKVGRDKFSELVVSNIRPEMEKNGIELTDVLIKRLNYTERVQERVFERMISERKRIAAELRSEGEGLKSEILGAMEKDLNQIESEAVRQAEINKGRADQTALRISGQAYGVNPDFYKFWVTLQSYQHILKDNTRLVIDADSEIYQFLKESR